ncbi:hypothetical protein AQUCO_00100173v1 [Aquilegia coerulea]|uniref:DNA helicase Pif1-like 2B domain-containing protein n=1 Tax=Aquilegia coerulea TaxID=218851 RepID=A0A2G5F928_AQUCA|nr:hypothetical protein AQUCO_00100173v1 [Aquilegia coerulea]
MMFSIKVGTFPDENLILPEAIQQCSNTHDLLSVVYPDLHVEGTATPSFLQDRTILAPRNDDVKQINAIALEIFPGNFVDYLAADKTIEREGDLPHEILSYTTDTLNSLDPSSLPPFRLRLKVGSPIMLLRNIAPKDGLCNGTRLIVEKFASKVIEARILTGPKANQPVFIPRITLSPSAELPIPMSRRQFPVRLAFAMTINKSQGQSVHFVGIDLQVPVFSHGQLYVALSRCTSAAKIFVILPSTAINCTTNIVYPEVLL